MPVRFGSLQGCFGTVPGFYDVIDEQCLGRQGLTSTELRTLETISLENRPDQRPGLQLQELLHKIPLSHHTSPNCNDRIEIKLFLKGTGHFAKSW